MAEKPFEKMTFNEAVNVLAGGALFKLIRGEQWRTIIWYVCNAMATWSNAQNKKKGKHSAR